MKHLLITGFAPFGGDSVNPSWEAVSALPDTIGGAVLHKLLLPVTFGGAAEAVLAEAERLGPDAVLSVGLAGSRSAVTPEYVGINLRHARIPDNAGQQPQDQPVVPGGPAAYCATAPVRAMAAAIERSGVPAAVSYTAGTFVCNEVLYSLLHRFDGTATRCGFIHLPWLDTQGKDGPSLTLEQMTAALTAAINAIFPEE